MWRQNVISKSIQHLFVLGAVFALLLAACGPQATATPTPTAAPSPSPVPPTAVPTEVAPSPTAADTVEPTATTAASTSTEGQIRLVLSPDGTEARYLVREQLANISLPSDAVGVTSDVTGMIVINPDGSLVSEESKFVVDLTKLTSDEGRRDNFIKGNTLETNRFPTAEFVPSQAVGLSAPLPTSGQVTFQLVGDMTVHGVTKQSTWDVTAQVMDGQALVGTAKTSFTFGDFGMSSPRVPVVLSVEETIRLEMDFNLVRES
jgi:polyisoprenoid-binding protein YceI